MGNYKIGTLSRRTGVHIETIRYYERIGLTPEPPRINGRFRTYDAQDAARLNFIRRCRELGFSLDEIRVLQKLAHGGEASCAEAGKTARHQLTAINQKIRDLKRMAKTLRMLTQDCVCDEEPAPSCPMLESLMSG
ncbi:MAG: transcriptional regulator [Robiginitomaculum sp.]|nr:MAG: transcriptional regulator [Robiginitomaculum sp.]